MRHGSLFSGIGGFDLAAEWMGWDNVFHCEIAEFPRQILKYHFPNSICYEDIKKTDFKKHRGEVDIISGGFPCQPYSNAGQRRGKEDDRHLWPEMLRVIREVQPRFVVGENVAGLLSWNNGMVFHEIITDLENEGYETQAFLIPACATNSVHRRDRIWFVANSNDTRTNERMQFNAEWKENDEQRRGHSQSEHWENGINGITPNSDKYGRQEQYRDMGEENGNNEGQGNEFICNAIKHESQNGNVAHTNGTKQGNNIREDIGEKGKIRWDKKSDVFGKLRSNGNVTDTDSQRTWEQSSEDRRWEDRRFDNNGETRNATDTLSEGLQGRFKSKFIDRKQESWEVWGDSSRLYQKNNWENFPTQSPVCGGNDGIPTELDGITFPKWRNESIKGYGNAVVPQVVYQIFKAIEKSIAK